MSSSMKEDYIQHLSFAFGAGITCTAGLMINVFIVTVNVTDWMNGRPVATTDQILTSLGITRMIYQSISFFDLFCDFFHINLPIIYIIIVECFWTMFFYASVWLSALLSVVFCLKISNFHSALFVRMKIILLQRVTRLIIASVLGSICYTSLCYLTIDFEFPKNLTNEKCEMGENEILYMFLSWNIAPFLIFFMSSVLLIISLCHHMYVMRRDRTETGLLVTYYKTIRFLTFSSFSYALFLIILVTIGFYQNSFDMFGLYFISNAFPTLHSTYLIYVTTKLRTRFSRIIQHGLKSLLNREHS